MIRRVTSLCFVTVHLTAARRPRIRTVMMKNQLADTPYRTPLHDTLSQSRLPLHIVLMFLGLLRYRQ